MNNIIDSVLTPKTNINITGKIFICDDLCNIIFNYSEYDKMLVFNREKYLELSYNTNSNVRYNGSEKFGSQYQTYNLMKVIIISPPKHYLNSARDEDDMEMVLIHQSVDKKRYQLISIILKPTYQPQVSLAYKLIEKFANNIPNKTVGVKTVEDIGKWNVQDLLPVDNRSFYTYNSPFNEAINWVVFEEKVLVPYQLKNNYDKYILNINPTWKSQIVDAGVPVNPESLVLFNHKYIKSIDDPATRCEKKKEAEKKSEAKQPEAKQPEEKKPEEKQPEEKQPEAKQPEEKKPEEKQPTTGLWWKIPLIILATILIFGLVGYLLFAGTGNIIENIKNLGERIRVGAITSFDYLKNTITAFMPTVEPSKPLQMANVNANANVNKNALNGNKRSLSNVNQNAEKIKSALSGGEIVKKLLQSEKLNRKLNHKLNHKYKN